MKARACSFTPIRRITEAFGQAAIRGREANFDAVWIHGGHGYLIHQFLSPLANTRTDEYGGAIANRARLTLEVTHAVTSVWGSDRVGIRFSPGGVFNDMHDSDPTATFSHVLHELNGCGSHAGQIAMNVLKRDCQEPDGMAGGLMPKRSRRNYFTFDGARV